MTEKLDLEIERLESLSLRQLRQYWESRLCGEPPPCRSAKILRRLLVYKIQEKTHGALSLATQKSLSKIARAVERNPGYQLFQGPSLKPGTILTREWQGTLHQVRVLEDGFEFEGMHLTSLSEAARKITGTRWSGPLFFGLNK